ncbi:MAG TPA: alpha/beta hydrolase [Motilibacteraceae bacterium]|nr:alpha/beta hydrolase [Motilibacteraceae bacterium]
MSDLEAVRVLRTASGVPDVVVLPGLGALPYLRPLVRELARHRTVAVLDVPGFRPGPDAPLPTSLPALGEVVYQWVRAHAPDALLLGHSTGAQLALHAAALGAPLRGLALVSTTFAPPVRTIPRAAAALLAGARHEPVHALLENLPTYAFGGRHTLAFLRAGLTDDPAQVAGTVQLPALLVRGRHDRLSTTRWNERLRRILGASLVELPGAHGVPHSAAVPLARLVLSYFA